MKTNIHILPAICILCFCACKSGNASSLNKNDVIQDTIKTFTLPAIPPMMTAPEQRADFLVKHYWDNVNFADTNYIHHPEVTEQAWADYCDILNHVPLETAQEAMRKTIEQTNVDKKVFTYITDLADKYLYDPNSPMRNEEFYIPVLDAMLASPLLEEIEKVRPKARRELAQKNRIGTKALNFSYTLASGAQGSLYQQQADYILLFINNPGCGMCKQLREQISGSPMLSEMIERGRLKVLALYPDEDLTEWRDYRDHIPASWINAYDKGCVVREKSLYDLHAIPALYLLDSRKRVLVKDSTDVAQIEEIIDRRA